MNYFPNWPQVVSHFNEAWALHYQTTPPDLSKGDSNISIVVGKPSKKWTLIGVDGLIKGYWTTATSGILFI